MTVRDLQVSDAVRAFENDDLKFKHAMRMQAERDQIMAPRKTASSVEGIYGLSERDNWLVAD